MRGSFHSTRAIPAAINPTPPILRRDDEDPRGCGYEDEARSGDPEGGRNRPVLSTIQARPPCHLALFHSLSLFVVDRVRDELAPHMLVSDLNVNGTPYLEEILADLRETQRLSVEVR